MTMANLVAMWVLGAGIAASPPDEPQLSRFQFVRTEMAVPVKIILYANGAETANRAAQAAFDRIRNLNAILSDYDPDSELRRLCDTAAAGEAVHVSLELWTVLDHAQGLARRSDGAFDVTVGPVVRLWRRARRRQQLPPPESLAESRELVGHRLVRLDSECRTVTLLKPGMRLDLGGIAKGYAIDQALEVLRDHGVNSALVDAGGDIGLAGPPPDRLGWVIGIAPLDAGAAPSRYLSLSQVAIANSGDAWQHVEIDGRRYSHIVDPKTGIGLTDHSSVTVIAPDAITADSLASAVSVLGPEKGIKLIDDTPNTAALIVRAPDGKVETHESRRWKQFKAVVPTTK